MTDEHETQALARALRMPSFGNTVVDAEDRGPVPISPTTLVLSVDQIEPYDRNPRRAAHPDFDRLKQSIASRKGLTTPLTVTRRPGASRYLVAAGGNSRLAALKTLFAETGDSVFGEVTCQFEPWTSDCHVLTNHLIENEVRGDLIFADRANAMAEWCEVFENEHPDKAPLSQRGLAQYLREAGFEISQASLSRLINAREFLMPYMPRAFETGLGTNSIARLLRFRALAKDYWDARKSADGKDDPRNFEGVFSEVCRAQDCVCVDWVHEFFVTALAQAIAFELELNPKGVQIDLEALQRGVQSGHVNTEATSECDSQNDGWVFDGERKRRKLDLERQRDRAERRSEPSQDAAESTDQSVGEDHSADIIVRAAVELPELRAATHASAMALASQFGMSDLVCQLDTGYGYFIEPPEPPNTVDGLSGTIWWWLAACAQQLRSAALDSFRQHQSDRWLVQLMDGTPTHLPETTAKQALEALVGEGDLSVVLGALLFHEELADTALTVLLNCRRLSQEASRRGQSLWI